PGPRRPHHLPPSPPGGRAARPERLSRGAGRRRHGEPPLRRRGKIPPRAVSPTPRGKSPDPGAIRRGNSPGPPPAEAGHPHSGVRQGFGGGGLGGLPYGQGEGPRRLRQPLSVNREQGPPRKPPRPGRPAGKALGTSVAR